jgi:hypothetical protein
MTEFERIWQRPTGPLPRASGGTYLSFEHPLVSDQEEIEAIFDTEAAFESGKGVLDQGFLLARELVEFRSARDYDDDFQIAETALFFRAINDLRAGGLLGRAGYALQGFGLIRSAVETAEIMDYLQRNPGAVGDYLAATGQFRRGVDWIRRELPFPDARAQLFDLLNWLTHANFQAINIYNYRDFPGTPHRVMRIGPMRPRHPDMSPIRVGATYVSYPIRVLVRCDPEVVPEAWLRSFDDYDRTHGNYYDNFDLFKDGGQPSGAQA